MGPAEILVAASGMTRSSDGRRHGTREAANVMTAYLCRPWNEDIPCTLDLICMLAIEHDVDPVPLMKMAQIAGAIDLDL